MNEQQLNRLLLWLDRRISDVNVDKSFVIASDDLQLHLNGEYTAYSDVLAKIEELMNE